MKVIGFVGMPASGKSEAATIATQMNLPVIVMGDSVRAYMLDHHIPITEKNVGIVANQLREERGLDAIAQMCIPLITKQKAEIVIIDGIRGYEEVLAFKNAFGDDFTLIAIDSLPELRYQRVKKRARADDALDYENFKTKDERELSWGLRAALNTADLHILNNSSLHEFRSLVSGLLRKQLATITHTESITIYICTPVHTTESSDKVETAIRNIFPDAVLTRSNNSIEGLSYSLETFAALLKSQRIRNTARTELLKNVSDNAFTFILNKQVAFVGKVNFSKNSLGPIYVEVCADNPDTIINTIAPEVTV